MLTEGWDANTVTHVLGVRAFGTQLLCEQVIGRALRRQSYELNEEGLFNVEYADVLGIPFDFNAKPVVAPPQPPRETIQVKAMRPERDALEIRFPRVVGYRTELPEERLIAEFNADSVLELTPELVGATETRNAGIIGATVDLNLMHTGDVRPSQIVYELTSYLVLSKWRDANGEPQSQPLRPAQAHRASMAGRLPGVQGRHLSGPTQIQDARRYGLRADHCRYHPRLHRQAPHQGLARPLQPGRLHRPRQLQHQQDRALGRPTPTAATSIGSFWIATGKAEFCRVAEAHPQVFAYVKNHNLGFEVPYRYGSESRRYLPDFIVLVDDGHGDDDLLHLTVEIKGYRGEDAKDKKATMDTYWVPGVNNLGTHGRWAFAEFGDVYQIESDFKTKVESEFNKMIERVVAEPAAQEA